MKQAGHTGFLLPIRDLAKNILVPRYYDPEISNDLSSLRARFDLPSLKELIESGFVQHSHGDYVPKIHYGTGPFPYVRTSDLANWEIKASPKHGVPAEVFSEYQSTQNVRPGDILFVQEGTYLVGTVAMVTELDGPLLYQHHLAKFRVQPECAFGPFYLLAAFESELVRRQVRSKQFSADIIDSVVGRLEEVVIPVPRDRNQLDEIQRRVELAVLERSKCRKLLSDSCVAIDNWMSSSTEESLSEVLESGVDSISETAFLGGRRGFSSSMLDSSKVRNEILLPKYYDPIVERLQKQYQLRCDVVSIEELVADGLVELDTGDEIGRLNYGTGPIPFVRTSDFGSWELKREAKQGVSESVYADWAADQDVKAGDILLVRDGTYLVGTSVLIDEADLPLLYCGGIYKIRSNTPCNLPPAFLFALFNTPFVQRQIRNKQFTRDVIDTLGQRIREIRLPIPTDVEAVRAIADHFENALKKRVVYRESLSKISQAMFQN